jgi:excisionase family DNA binding protein
MPPLSLAEAARETGKSKATVWRAVKSGRLSASRADGGDYLIDPAELARAFPPEPARGDAVKHGETSDDTARNGEAAVLRERLAAKEELIVELRARLADEKARTAELIEDRDKWRGEVEAVRLLAAPPARYGLIARLLWRRG